MNSRSSPWLKVWDLIDLEWQRVERMLLGALFALVLASALLQFGLSALSLEAPDAIGELLPALTLWFVMLAASSWLASWCTARLQTAASVLQRVWHGALYLLASLVCLLLCLAALRFLALDWHLGSAALLGLSGWLWLLPLPLLFLFMSLRLLRLSLQQLA